jgi:hypothetical protein
LYHYVKTNATAISEVFSQQRLIDIRYNADAAISVLRESYPGDLEKEIAFFKLNIKLPFIITDDTVKHQVWKEWYPEANEYIMKNSHLGFRSRLLQWMAWKRQWWFVRAYYVLVYRLVYGIIYK